MPTYALLGATGSTGKAILRHLLSQPPTDLTLNIFIRSEPKLRKEFPNLESSASFKIKIFEGVPSDDAVMQECLKDADVVMVCIASNWSAPGLSISYDTATAIVGALQAHRQSQGPAYKRPTVIQIRSISLNPVLNPRQFWLGAKIVGFCIYYVYADLERACTVLDSAASDSPSLLDCIYMDPPALHDADGTTPTGYRLILDEDQEPALSYADLGVAFCEVAERRQEFAGKAVGIVATGAVNLTMGALIGYMATGLKGRVWG